MSFSSATCQYHDRNMKFQMYSINKRCIQIDLVFILIHVILLFTCTVGTHQYHTIDSVNVESPNNEETLSSGAYHISDGLSHRLKRDIHETSALERPVESADDLRSTAITQNSTTGNEENAAENRQNSTPTTHITPQEIATTKASTIGTQVPLDGSNDGPSTIAVPSITTTAPSSTTTESNTSTLASTTEESTSITAVPSTTSSSTTEESPTSTSTSAEQYTTLTSNVTFDDHRYYKSQTLRDEDVSALWVDFDNLDTNTVTHETLSNSHRTAATIELRFNFDFYGHTLKQVTIATGGFLYMSSFLHQWLTAYQYIAPLMANFDTQLGDNSNVRFADNGTALIVFWEDVHLRDHQHELPFSFQTILKDDGTIIFLYKDVPLPLNSISSSDHPVKIGLSDAYYVDKQVTEHTRRRSIFGYHKVALQMTAVTNKTAFIITPNPTCIAIKDCAACINSQIGFQCEWCGRAGRCSDGMDRMRQDWTHNRCHMTDPVTLPDCPKYPYKPFDSSNPMANNMRHRSELNKDPVQKRSGISPEGVVALLFIIALLGFIGGCVLYAYKYPQSRAGIWFIEHRPTRMKEKLSRLFFWRRSDSGDKYHVSMHPERGDSTDA